MGCTTTGRAVRPSTCGHCQLQHVQPPDTICRSPVVRLVHCHSHTPASASTLTLLWRMSAAAPSSLTATNSTSGNKASRRLLWQPVDDTGNVFTKPEQQMVQLTDPAVMERGWPRILDRLRVGGPGADIRHAVWWTHPLSGRCQSKTSLGNCNEEALELLLDDIHGMLGWW